MLRADPVQICTSRWVKWAEKRGTVAGRVRTAEARVVRHSTTEQKTEVGGSRPFEGFPL